MVQDEGFVLDQEEVLRAMLGTQNRRGKGDSEDDNGDSDDESEQSFGRGSDGQEGQNGVKRSHSPRTAVEAPARSSSPLTPPSRANAQASTSRVQLPTCALPTLNGKSRVSPLVEATKLPLTTTFVSLGLSLPLISALETINIRKPTEIQAACVGPILEGGLLHTGSP